MIYIVMAAVFESLLFPSAIMSGVLFSVFGVFWLFWLTGTEFNIMAFIGILVLMGVVVNNGIVMIEHINNLRRRGMSRTEALVEGSKERLRPILMTMGTAILAMVPIAIGGTQMGGDGPAYYPMARAIAGGLAFSTIVSLLFLPTIYALLDDLRTGTARVIAPCARQVDRRRCPRAAVAAIRGIDRRSGSIAVARNENGKADALGAGFLRGLMCGRAISRAACPASRSPPVHTPIAVPRLVRKKFSSTRATRLRHQPRKRLHVVAQRHEVGVGRLAHPGLDQRTDRARGQRRMQRRDRRGDERGQDAQRVAAGERRSRSRRARR